MILWTYRVSKQAVDEWNKVKGYNHFFEKSKRNALLHGKKKALELGLNPDKVEVKVESIGRSLPTFIVEYPD